MKTKEEIIREAYGVNYNPHIDENGWFDMAYFDHVNITSEQFNEWSKKNANIRPKSLQGIETNNSWTKIESEADLPKAGAYDMSRFKLIYWTDNGLYYSEDYKRHKLHYDNLEITHYQLLPIQKPLPPLF